MQAASCMWTTSETLTASLDYRATCMPNDTITVLGGIIKPFCAYSDCSCWPLSNASGPVQIATPDTAHARRGVRRLAVDRLVQQSRH